MCIGVIGQQTWGLMFDPMHSYIVYGLKLKTSYLENGWNLNVTCLKCINNKV